jgi:hypothetical protein
VKQQKPKQTEQPAYYKTSIIASPLNKKFEETTTHSRTNNGVSSYHMYNNIDNNSSANVPSYRPTSSSNYTKNEEQYIPSSMTQALYNNFMNDHQQHKSTTYSSIA